jgi:16S rRNA (cytosine967-C5)-methyltransferase
MDNTRLFALHLLRAVLDQHRPLEEALDRLPEGEARDRAAAHRLAATVLRRAGTLDAVLEPHVRRAPPDAVRAILRLGAAQLLLLNTPPHAAVGTSVALARSQKLAPFAGLVNAVLRRVAEAGRARLSELDSPRLDTPAWLWASWGSDARAIATAHQQEAPLDLTLRPGAAAPEGGLALPTGSMRFAAGTRLAELPGFSDGDFWVQDAAAALPARLLAARPGENVRGAGRQDGAARGGGRPGHRDRSERKAAAALARQPGAVAAAGRACAGRCRDLAAG